MGGEEGKHKERDTREVRGRERGEESRVSDGQGSAEKKKKECTVSAQVGGGADGMKERESEGE